ncbi:MAG: hypothetical protein LBH31_02375 [Burkholderiaceae bacterium]|nr:hypothetical protein [Burkholderiaceae bacterium]
MKNRNFTRTTLAAGAAAGALVLLAGCVVAPAPYYDPSGAQQGYPGAAPGYAYGGGYPASGDAPVYATMAPPAPYVEVQPVIPFAGAIWIGGFWNWSGGRYSWVGGHYERPRAGYSYEPRRWSQGSGGHWKLGGGWKRR